MHLRRYFDVCFAFYFMSERQESAHVCLYVCILVISLIISLFCLGVERIASGRAFQFTKAFYLSLVCHKDGMPCA